MFSTIMEHRKKWALRYSIILLVLALLVYAVLFSWLSWREAKSDEASRLVMTAELGARAVDSYFTQLEIALHSLALDIPGTSKQQPDFEHAFELLGRFQQLHSEVSNVMLMRADGQILLNGNTRYSRELPTLAHDLSFMKFRDELQRGTSLVIGQPVKGHIDKSWVVPARYGIVNNTGELIYILSANLPIDLLQRYWVDSPGARVSALGLIRDDGYLLSRYPEADTAQLDVLYGNPVTGSMVDYLNVKNFPQQERVEYQGFTGTDIHMRVMRPLQHFPLTLFVEMPMSEIKAVWWSRVQAHYVLLALMLAGILLGSHLLLRRRQAWTLEQRREAIRSSHEHALQERSQNEILMFDVDTLQLTHANDNALDNLGYSIEEIRRKNMLAVHPELGIESFSSMVEPLRMGEREAIKYQTVQARANGSTYPVEVNLLLITADGRQSFLAIIDDITALRQAEENVRNFNAPVERRSRMDNSRAASPDTAT